MPSRTTLYNRRNDVKRLREAAVSAPLIVSVDERGRYCVALERDPGTVMIAARYEVAYAYVSGFSRGFNLADAGCTDFRPDHNGECLNCDEPASEHKPT